MIYIITHKRVEVQRTQSLTDALAYLAGRCKGTTLLEIIKDGWAIQGHEIKAVDLFTEAGEPE